MKIVKDGRLIEPGSACRKLNPHLFAAGGSCEAEAMTTTPAVTKPSRRIRQDSKPLMNKLEADFKSHYEKMTGYELTPQALRFRLGNGIWYKPDFVIFCRDGMTRAFEVKGPHAFRGGFENLKVAAGLYKDVNWVLAWKEGNEWKTQYVLP